MNTNDITQSIAFDDECNNDDARDAIHDAHDAITQRTFTMKQRDDMIRALIASYRDLNVVRTFIDDIAHVRTHDDDMTYDQLIEHALSSIERATTAYAKSHDIDTYLHHEYDARMHALCVIASSIRALNETQSTHLTYDQLIECALSLIECASTTYSKNHTIDTFDENVYNDFVRISQSIVAIRNK